MVMTTREQPRPTGRGRDPNNDSDAGSHAGDKDWNTFHLRLPAARVRFGSRASSIYQSEGCSDARSRGGP
jgi:hypothetical protein